MSQANYYLTGAKLTFPGFDKPVTTLSLPEGDCDKIDPTVGKFTMSGRITSAHVNGFPVKRMKFMRVRHKATGRTALGIAMKDGLMIVQFNNVKAMGWLSGGWHLYPRHHFKRRRK